METTKHSQTGKKKVKELSETDLVKKLKALGKLDEGQKKSVACSLIGHSRIVSNCMGYKYCGRCEAQVGDSLGGIWDGTNAVVIGHNCPTCRKNYKAMGWRDKFLVANPFKKEGPAS